MSFILATTWTNYQIVPDSTNIVILGVNEAVQKISNFDHFKLFKIFPYDIKELHDCFTTWHTTMDGIKNRSFNNHQTYTV